MTDTAHSNQQFMTIASFLDRHLPSTGHCCVARHANGKFSPSFHPDTHQAAARATVLDAGGRGEVYFACAAYVDPLQGRKGRNVLAVRCFWFDIDTRESKSDAPYADKEEAKVALARFCCVVGMPSPTVVDSGNGLHVYWPTDDELTPDEWRRVAKLFERAARKAGLKVDPSRTTDIASVLRVPGTANRKVPGKPRPVRLLYLGSPTSCAQLNATLLAYAGPEAAPGGLNNTRRFNSNFPPSNAIQLAERCAVIRHVRDTGGNVPEPLWHAALGVLVHTIQGDAVCHDFSRGHPNYDPVETQSKLDRLRTFGPTSCARLSTLSDGLCRGCAYGEGA
jgi:hypothetical protein